MCSLPLKGGGANIAAGLQAVQQTVFQLNYGDRATAVNILIVLTAGASSGKLIIFVEPVNVIFYYCKRRRFHNFCDDHSCK